jgi:hypothetical protein
MPDDQRALLVRKMVAEGTSDNDIRATLKAYDARTPRRAPKAAEGSSFLDSALEDNAALPPLARAGQFVARMVKQHPVQAGAMAGSALATGGASIPAQLGLAALGAAGGAGYGLLTKGATTGDFGTPGGNAATMAQEGAAGAAGEGAGQLASKALAKGAYRIYRGVLRPSAPLQREFGDVAATGIREGIPVSDSGAKTATSRIEDLAGQVRGRLAAKDAERPVVAGYLQPAQSVSLGKAPIHPTMPELRDPRSAGVLLRDAPADVYDGAAAHGNMIAPQEIAQRGLSGARADVADRALAGDALDQIGALEQRFLTQRNQPFTLQETQRLKQAEQGLADTAYRAEQNGGPVNGVDARFHQGVARGAREAIEQRVPDVAPLNQRTQGLIGLRNALDNATRRNVSIGIKSLIGDTTPGLISGAAIGADRAAPMATPLIRALLAAIGGGGQ